MIPEYFAIVGAIIASIGTLYYVYETLTGKSRPNRITWLLWGIFPLITFVAQRAQGVEGVSWASFAAGFPALLIVAASFINKKAYWQTRRLDYFLMIAAITGIVLWAITDNANLAIFFALLADLCAGIPTLIKAYKHPQTESWVAYTLGAFGFTLGILTISEFKFENTAFIVYLALMNGVLACLSIRKPSKDPLHIEP